ncbi:MAG: hypothetical protein PVI90_18455, partial [Desulfobacteraceae bacterium]
ATVITLANTTGEDRSGNITIAGHTVSVSQEAGYSDSVIPIDPITEYSTSNSVMFLKELP